MTYFLFHMYIFKRSLGKYQPYELNYHFNWHAGQKQAFQDKKKKLGTQVAFFVKKKK